MLFCSSAKILLKLGVREGRRAAHLRKQKNMFRHSYNNNLGSTAENHYEINVNTITDRMSGDNIKINNEVTRK